MGFCGFNSKSSNSAKILHDSEATLSEEECCTLEGSDEEDKVAPYICSFS